MKNLIQLIAFLLFFSGFSQSILDKKLEKFEGFFDFYYDASTDKIYLEVENLDSDFLYINSLATGIGSNDIGLDRGQLGNERLVSFQKAGNKLLLIQPNLSFRAITTNKAEENSIREAFAKSSIVAIPLPPPVITIPAGSSPLLPIFFRCASTNSNMSESLAVTISFKCFLSISRSQGLSLYTPIIKLDIWFTTSSSASSSFNGPFA